MLGGRGFGSTPTVDAAAPARRAGRCGADPRRPRVLGSGSRASSARPRSTSPAPILARQRNAARTLRRHGALRDPAARPRRRHRPPGPGTGPGACAATRRSRRSRPGTGARSTSFARPRRALIIADFHADIKTAVNDTVDQLEPHPRRTDQCRPSTPPRPASPTLSRALQDESISASERAELIALPILLIVLLLVFRSPIAAAIPLTFGAITVFTSRGSSLLHVLVRHRRLRADGLHDDGPGPGSGLCAADGLALPRGAGRRGRPADAAAADPPHRRPHDGLRREHPALSMLVSLFVVPGPAARLAGRDGGHGRRPQRLRRHPGRPGAAHLDRPQHRSLADRRRRRTRARG